VNEERPYADPYLAGAALGVVLLAAFVITGRGLGASGAFTTTAAGLTHAVAPARAADSALFARYLDGDYWLLFEILGVITGGFVSALLAGRVRRGVDRGANITNRTRLVFAFIGGSVMGLGAVLARGCTSGLGLTGGALLSAGSWLFIGAAFAAAYLVSPLVRRAWK
jgi:uncharacterized membrane protein YedE/YeeE